MARLWLLVGVIGASALTLFLWHVSALASTSSEIRIPWWALLALFAVSEVAVVHVFFGGEAHSFSLSEVPLVLGLFFADPVTVVACYVVGASLALVIFRRQRPVKAAFNMASFAVQASLATTVFYLIHDMQGPLQPISWVAALAATICVLTVADSLINLAIRLSGARLSIREMLMTLCVGAIATTMGTSLALIAAVILWTAPGAGWMAAVPTLTLFLAFRAYSGQRLERERMVALYEATRRLHASPGFETTLKTAARCAREMVEAEFALVATFMSKETVVSSLDHRDGRTSNGGMQNKTWPSGTLDELDSLNEPVFISGSQRTALLRSLVPGNDVRNGLLAPLRIDGRLAGAVVVANRLGDASSFSSLDLKTLQTLTEHISVSLSNCRLEDSLSEVTELKEQLRHQAFHDDLTHLANRLLFVERIEHALERRSGATNLAVAFIDIDDFKTLNDSLGHAAGDAALVAAANALKSCLRPADTAARLGGDEFAILLEDLDSADDVHGVAQRILYTLRQPVRVQGQTLTLHASVGFAVAQPGDTVEALMRNADAAMYAAKRNGKDGYALFEPEMHRSASRRLEMKRGLIEALENREFEVYYQPMIRLEDESVIGVEALVRWRHPQRGLLTPEEFISLSEETGLIIPIGRWVLEQACASLPALSEAYGNPELSLSVNLSSRQVEDTRLAAIVAETIERTGLEPHRLILEITESSLMDEAGAAVLEAVSTLGVRLAIDDFGTGFSSLSYLDRFPIDILKIDRTFICSLGDKGGDPTLTRAILNLGVSMNMGIIAEGIETSVQNEILAGMGCDFGQGYLFAPPRPLEDITDSFEPYVVKPAS
ncbi:MAG: putative bifunctional diguanylate cyclase/phosphodiesterase [Actinomycetota bacterium]